MAARRPFQERCPQRVTQPPGAGDWIASGSLYALLTFAAAMKSRSGGYTDDRQRFPLKMP